MIKMGTILATLLLLVTIQSAFHFLGSIKVTFAEWLVFNACAPADITYLVGFILFRQLNNTTVMYMAVLPMFFFGFLDLFVFPWSGMHIIPQVGHIIMSLNLAWLVWYAFRTADYRSAATGLFLGIAVFSVFIGFQQHYVASRPEDFARILKLGKP